MFQKRTLRHLPPDTRKMAVACNDVERALGRWKRYIPQMASDERRWRADHRHLLAQGLKAAHRIPDQAEPCPEHGHVVVLGCKGCTAFAMAWMRQSMEGVVLDGEPSLLS